MRLFPAAVTHALRAGFLCGALCAMSARAQSSSSGFPTTPMPGDMGPTPTELIVAFFPSTPPAYGATVTQPTTVWTRIGGRLMQPPEDLAEYVGEIFYPMIGSRLFSGSLNSKLDTRLTAYRTKRATLLDDLAAVLAAQQNATPAAREQALRAFAPQQAGPLAELEAEAESLRRDLIKGGLFSDVVDWNSTRNWRLGDKPVAADPVKADAEFQVARAAAYFQHGLSIEQRGLVRELAMELSHTARSVRGRPAQRDDDPLAIFFAPETARFRLPQPLPPELVTLLGRFNAEKSALKRELHDSLVKFDTASDAKRATRFSDLASHQAPRLAALEKQAEEIRLGLAAHLPPPPALPPIPSDLRERIDRFTRDRDAFSAASVSTAARARNSVPTDWTALSRATPAQRERMMREQQQRQVEAVQAAAKEFKEKNNARGVELYERYQRIRADLAIAAQGLQDPRTKQPMTVEGLLAAYRVAMQRFDAIGREEAMYERYKHAMLQPGLSPAQRRLLFRAAHAGLAQSLPPPDVVTSPQSRPKTTL